MRLTERLNQLEAILAQVTSEFEEISQQIVKLEQENERLRGQLSPHNKPDVAAATTEPNAPSNDGHDTLVKLYEEGYHVCHLNFGQQRQGECLFCLGFLSNAQ